MTFDLNIVYGISNKFPLGGDLLSNDVNKKVDLDKRKQDIISKINDLPIEDKHKVFIIAYCKNGMKLGEAYAVAYVKEKVDRACIAHGSRLMAGLVADGNCTELIDSYKKILLEEIDITIPDVLFELKQIAIDQTQYSRDRIFALDLLGKYHKMFTDKHELSADKETIELIMSAYDKRKKDDK